MPLKEAGFAYVRDLVRERAAITLDAGQGVLVEARLSPLARRQGLDSVDKLLDSLRTMPFGILHTQVVEAMTTNETSFFRDFHVFDTLKKKVLPDLALRRARERRLHIWCNACSSGQEAYSLAMLLRECPDLFAGWNLQILASDISNDMLAQARDGRYSQLEVNRGLPAAYLVKYFEKNGSDWQLKPGIRQMVQFRRINLAETWPVLPRVDLLFMRNVLIYFDVEARNRTLDRGRKLLGNDGILFLGAAETVIHLDGGFQRIRDDRTVYYQRSSVT